MHQQFGGGGQMSDADVSEPAPNHYIASLEEQARIKGAKPVTSIHELAGDGFESDEKLDEFLVWLYNMRHANPA